MKSIKNIKNLRGKRVLVRCDFNVPIKNARVLDDFKIVKQLDTLRFLLKKGCKVILVTHLGRPKLDEDLSLFLLDPIARRLENLLSKKILYVKDVLGFEATTAIVKMKEGEVVLLDNIRFYKGELKNDKKFAKSIAKLFDIYINNAFAVSHRAQASVSAITKYIDAYPGMLLEKEITNLSKAQNPKKPLVAIVGGLKLKTKIPLIKKLSKIADHVLVGGALANDFLVANNLEVGKSVIDTEGIYFVKKYQPRNVLVPVDVVVSTNKAGGHAMVKSVNKVGKNDYIFDIGPETIKLYASFIKMANTIVWNGPMGFFELKDFRHGTLAVARLVASRSKGKAYGIVGGGETVEALKMTKMIDDVDWVSTGGGAMLSYLGGKKMPGLIF